jgi:hypothetical protein
MLNVTPPAIPLPPCATHRLVDQLGASDLIREDRPVLDRLELAHLAVLPD